MSEHVRPSFEEERRLAVGQAVLERVRGRANGEFASFGDDEHRDYFTDLYLTSRETAVPQDFAEESFDLNRDVKLVFAQVFDGLADEIRERHGRDDSLWVLIDAAVDDTTLTVLCTDRTVLLLHGTKPWNFWWADESAMADELGGWYETAAAQLLGERQRRTTIYGKTT